MTHVLKPARSFKELAKNQHFGQTQASLAIAGETLLIRTQSQLLGIRAAKPAPKPTTSPGSEP